MSTDKQTIQRKIEALRELRAEKRKREQEATDRAYANTIRDRGTIPQIILDEPDKDAQLKQMLGELGHPEFCIMIEVIDPPARQDEPASNLSPLSQPKAFVDENVEHAQAGAMSALNEPSRDASHCMTMEHGQPIYYLFDPSTRTITLAEHGGAPTRISGRMFQDRLGPNANADDVAVILWERSRGRSTDDPNDVYIPAMRLPGGI